MKLKRYNGTAWEQYYPETSVAQVVGLQTDLDAKIDKVTGQESKIPTFTSTGALQGSFATVETVSAENTDIATSGAVKAYVDGLLSASDAMVFKGTLGTGGTITALPTGAGVSAGHAYKVITAGTFDSKVCEVGDLIIATVDDPGAGDWTVVQTNLDGAVTGPASAVYGNFPIFQNTTGKVISDAGYKPLPSATPWTANDNYLPTSKSVQNYVEGLGYSTTTGTVTSVGGTGSVNGLTLSGTVTGSGNLTLAGDLSVSGDDFDEVSASKVLIGGVNQNGKPSFRTLLKEDIPTNIFTGTTAPLVGFYTGNNATGVLWFDTSA